MTTHFLILLSLLLSLSSVDAQTPPCTERFCLVSDSHLVHSYVLSPDEGVTTNLRSGHSRRHHRRHLRNGHGILNIIGWGTLLPIGVIIARYYRNLPMKCSQWYSLHVLCQISGYTLGTIGWGVGMWLGNASKEYAFKTHRILGTIIFALATIQLFALCLQPKKDNKCRKYWEVYHHLLGYALIILIIVNIFQGIDRQSPANKWIWSYVGVLGVLAATAAGHEIFRCTRFIKHPPVVFNSGSYAS